MQEVSWDNGSTVRAVEYIFFYGKEMIIIDWEQDFFVHHRTGSAIKGVEFVSDRMSYIVLRGRWCNIIVLNVQATSEEKSDGLKYSFMRNYSRFFIIFPTTV